MSFHLHYTPHLDAEKKSPKKMIYLPICLYACVRTFAFPFLMYILRLIIVNRNNTFFIVTRFKKFRPSCLIWNIHWYFSVLSEVSFYRCWLSLWNVNALHNVYALYKYLNFYISPTLFNCEQPLNLKKKPGEFLAGLQKSGYVCEPSPVERSNKSSNKDL